MSFVAEPHGSYFLGDELSHLPLIDVESGTNSKGQTIRSAKPVEGEMKKKKRLKRKKKKKPQPESEPEPEPQLEPEPRSLSLG